MPPKRLLRGQSRLTASGPSLPTSHDSSQSSDSSSSRRGELDSWRKFAESKLKERFPWILVQQDGVYCSYCAQGVVRGVSSSGSDVFLSKGYTGSRPDVLSRHQSSTQHQNCAST